jgi:hypothetical protein
MPVAAGSQGKADYCILNGVINYSLDGGNTWTPAGSSSAVPSKTSIILARAQTLLGSTMQVLMGTDFENTSWYRTSDSGTGNSHLSQVDMAGVLILDSGATAVGVSQIGPAGAAGESVVANQQTGLWYFYMRAAIVTALDSVAVVTGGLSSTGLSGPMARIGGNGAVSTGFFSGVTTNAGNAQVGSAITTVALDTNYHDFEMWNNGTTLTFAVDGITATTPSTNAASAPGGVLVIAFNSTTNADRQMKVDRLYIVTPSN